MQRIQTCDLPNDYRHVCFKDLEAYINIDNFIDVLKGYSSIELNEIKKALGIPSTIFIDSDMNMYSKNPVENRAIFEALSKKVDKSRIADVAITGCYRDLKGTPINLPNPEGLVIQDSNGEYKVYDGSEAIKITLPQQIKDFPDWKEFVVDYKAIERMVPIKNITLNGVMLPINSGKVVAINTLTWEDVQKKLKQYVSVDDFNNYKAQVEQNLVTKINALRLEFQNKLKETTNDYQTQINSINNTITGLQNLTENNRQGLEDEIQAIKNSLQELKDSVKVLQNDVDVLKAKI